MRTMEIAQLLMLALVGSAEAADLPGWPAYGGGPGGLKYSAARQITPDNVGSLGQAWEYHTGETADAAKGGAGAAFEATPILVDGSLVFSTPLGKVIALDAATGREIWRHDTSPDLAIAHSEMTSRGVSAWRDGSQPPDGPCAVRIFFGNIDAKLVALDARTGMPCRSFGTDGVVDLSSGMKLLGRGGYLVTSPPAIAGDLVITGSAIGDNRAIEVEKGVVRAYDARTGALRWRWDPIPTDPRDPASAAWRSDQAERTGAANAWSILSVDAERDLVFVPTGSAAPDFFGGGRLGDDLYANSLVALRASTGEMVWYRQFVHHDLWDYDVPAQPVLSEIDRDGSPVPVVIQTTKMGLVFVLERETGAPFFPIEERPVPQDAAPGEVPAATQPFPVRPEPLVSHAAVKPDDAWGLTFWDRGKCRDQIGRLRSEGIYTPPSLAGSIEYPGYGGGSSWGGLAYDPERQIAVAYVIQLPMEVSLVPRDEWLAQSRSGRHPGREFGPMTGAPYGIRRGPLLSPFGVPCTAPPWGLLAAIDMRGGNVLWKVPLGTTRDIAPIWLNLGVPGLGGPLVTASGLVFIGATTDNYLRAISVLNGRELWSGRLPAGGQASPMTYVLPKSGKQYVVIAAGGHGKLGTTKGDSVIAYALR